MEGWKPDVVGRMVDCTVDEHAGEGSNQNMLDLVSEARLLDGRSVNSPTRNFLSVEEDTNGEPHNGIEFESHEAAYKFYQEYAKSMGFTTSIKNSRRSKKSKDFIDAKFACSRYGITPDSDSASTSRRPLIKKTDCKASMHVKRNRLGKWVIHEFIKEHNHELLPALAYHFQIQRNVKLAEKNNLDILHAVSERTKKMYVEMSKQRGRCQSVGLSKGESGHHFGNGRRLVLDHEGDSQVLLDYFTHMRKEKPQFFYAIDLNEEQQLRNLLWIDAKSRADYTSFSDVVSFDTTYIRNNDKLPLALFIGANNHFQPILLGCALVADQSAATFLWLMKTWLRAMGGKAPRVVISDQQTPLTAALAEVFPMSRHCYPLWCILEKVPENLADVIKRHEHFVRKFNKCVFKSWTDEQFEARWWKMVGRFDLWEDDWVRSLYEDGKKWLPLYMGDVFLAGMSTVHRSESVNSFFDKYIQRKITVKEFMKQYVAILQNRYEEEDMADFDTWQKQPALKSPSPWEKQMSVVYTHAIFKKFQVEVLGVVGCHPKKESADGASVTTYRVEDCEKDETFFVAWNETKSEVDCLCRSFQYKGFLCRHAMIVLQICGISRIPSQYILTRWTKDAKSKQSMVHETQLMQTRVQRYNDLCKKAIELSEEGSFSQESYNIAFRAMAEILKNCVNVNNSNETALEIGSKAYTLRDDGGNLSTKMAKQKNVAKKRKVTSEEHVVISGTHESLHQMLQLNLMEPPYDGYYVNHQSLQGLGPMNNPVASSHDEFFGVQQSVHGLGQLDFRPSSSFTYCLQFVCFIDSQDEPRI
ncbi:cyclin-dependent kinase inhibitor far1 [Dionaea muscipula]